MKGLQQVREQEFQDDWRDKYWLRFAEEKRIPFPSFVFFIPRAPLAFVRSGTLGAVPSRLTTKCKRSVRHAHRIDD
jgi:hypothetical protein